MNLNQRLYLRDSDRPKPQRFEESPEWADELDEARRKDSWVGKSIMYLIGTTAVMAAIKFLNEKFNWL